MLLDADSVKLYESYIEEHEMSLCVFIRKDDGLVLRLEKRGIEFFKQLPTLSPDDDLHKGDYVSIKCMKKNIELAIKEFAGVDYDIGDIYPVLIFNLLYELWLKL